MELVIVRHTIIVYYTIGIPSYSPQQKYCPINYIILYAGYRYARVGNLAVHRGVRTIYVGYPLYPHNPSPSHTLFAVPPGSRSCI